jgi:hypothetical protein
MASRGNGGRRAARRPYPAPRGGCQVIGLCHLHRRRRIGDTTQLGRRERADASFPRLLLAGRDG